MGCAPCTNSETEQNLTDLKFQDTKSDLESPKLKNRLNTDHNKFIEAFERNMKYIGEYIPISDFNSLIPEKIQKYMVENCLDLGQYLKKGQRTYEVKPVEFKNGNIYSGNWSDTFEMDGYGKYYLKDDKVLAEGVWDKGELKFSRVFLPNGEIYEGDIKNSIFNGKGKLISINGDIYEGDFVDGEKTGYGRIIFSDGTEYSGEVNKGNINGKGNMKWKNGYEYQGNFSGNTLSGHGYLANELGDRYEGNFELNQFHGKGKYSHKNGDIYEGEFDMSVRKGKGIYQKSNGLLFEGRWDNNVPNGFGKITKNGNEAKSSWRNGKIADAPEYEKGKEGSLKEEDLNFKIEDMNLTTKGLTNLDSYSVNTNHYNPGTLPSFLDDQ